MTDLMMPGHTGLALLGEARRAHAQTPVIAMTGRRDDVIARAAFSEGIFNFLWKPLDREEVVQVVRSALLVYRLRELVDLQVDRVQSLRELIQQTEQHRLGHLLGPDAIRARTLAIQRQTLGRFIRNADTFMQNLRRHEHLLELTRSS